MQMDDVALGAAAPSKDEAVATNTVVRRQRKPTPKFDYNQLLKKQGIYTIVREFPRLQFQGKGHEAEDLNLLMNSYKAWGYQLWPQLDWEHLYPKIEKASSNAVVKDALGDLRGETNVATLITLVDQICGRYNWGEEQPMGTSSAPAELQQHFIPLGRDYEENMEDLFRDDQKHNPYDEDEDILASMALEQPEIWDAMQQRIHPPAHSNDNLVSGASSVSSSSSSSSSSALDVTNVSSSSSPASTSSSSSSSSTSMQSTSVPDAAHSSSLSAHQLEIIEKRREEALARRRKRLEQRKRHADPPSLAEVPSPKKQKSQELAVDDDDDDDDDGDDGNVNSGS